jgi:hypothetical protein
MIYGYTRVSTDGQSVDAQVRQLAKAGCSKVFREVASGAKTDRTQLRTDAHRAGRPGRLCGARGYAVQSCLSTAFDLCSGTVALRIFAAQD